MRIIENEQVDSGFLERAVDFPLKNGLIIEKKVRDCKIKSYFKTDKSDNFFPVLDKFPPVDCVIKAFVFEFDVDQHGFSFVEFVDIDECPSARIELTAANVDKSLPKGFSIQIRFPPELIDIPKEAEVQGSDGIIAKVRKSSTNFLWAADALRCVLAAGLNYRVRFRARIDDVTSEWSNWLSFKVPPKRSLGRRFK